MSIVVGLLTLLAAVFDVLAVVHATCLLVLFVNHYWCNDGFLLHYGANDFST